MNKYRLQRKFNFRMRKLRGFLVERKEELVITIMVIVIIFFILWVLGTLPAHR